MFQRKVVVKIKTHTFMSDNLLSENRAGAKQATDVTVTRRMLDN